MGMTNIGAVTAVLAEDETLLRQFLKKEAGKAVARTLGGGRGGTWSGGCGIDLRAQTERGVSGYSHARVDRARSRDTNR